MNTLTRFDADLITEWNGDLSASGTALLEPDHLETNAPSWSENIAVCDVDDDLDDDEAYFLDDEEDEDDDYSDDYDDDGFEEEDYDTDSDDDFDDDDL